MRIPHQDWVRREQAHGILFFAQLLHEMLYDNSWDNHRAHSLDTVHRLYEAIVVAGQVQRGNIPKVALEPVVDELVWSLETDPVARGIIGEEASDLVAQVKRQVPDVRALAQRFRFVLSLIEKKYKSGCEEVLSEVIPDGRKKDRINRLRNSMCLIWSISDMIGSTFIDVQRKYSMSVHTRESIGGR